ncbi:MAG: SDR family oxidoreductase [Rhodospirillaceae bacterium]|jgi:2-dehydro-3-deoxy-L-rhamnonate dehydrogenase (NAD+)|nr:SDR family oxidoreductase [Rhodospirillaceae bacterium]MBT3886501.1 SDR family oxidoreductase [Rhodospirillaceae bacterium]MBT4116197.1 SDR family oxidoreductase [Rhodospirillaceae bacterium]MBT4672136.1 SDR family oxidoreductase [Rhodospirillaceae bacterium]MBT4718653.1 SDR family oxidoreductase [Rhodospirillaceae bacterium]
MGANVIDLSGRCAVVTGGATGLGYAIAERFLASGANVCIWDLNQDAIDGALVSLNGLGNGGAATGQICDISDPGAVEMAANTSHSELGAIDILVNNAGISGPNVPSWEYPVEDWLQVINVDLTGTFLVSRAVIPGMLERDYGRIVNIASVAGKEGNPNAPAYSSAKAGVIGLTKTLGKELAKSGVVVNCVAPAAVRTAIFDQMSEEHINFMLSKIPMNRFGQAEEIAAMVAWLCSEECSFSTGAVFDISGGRATY